jgi:hypothetical protein
MGHSGHTNKKMYKYEDKEKEWFLGVKKKLILKILFYTWYNKAT